MTELKPGTVQRLCVGELLGEGSHRFRLASHQGHFRWGKEERERFWSELMEAVEEGAEDYPLGSLVLETTASGELLVADGQQKLTTVTILLALLRDRLELLGEEEGEKRLDSLITRTTEQGDREPFLVLRDQEQEFFHKYVLARSGENGRVPGAFPLTEQSPKCHQRIARMYSGLSAKLDSWLEREPHRNLTQRLLELTQTLLDVPRLVVVCRESDCPAQNPFTSLSERDLDLVLADRFQCFFLPLAPTTEHREIKRLWHEVQENVSLLGLSRFLRHYWMSRMESLPSAELYTSIKRHLFWEKVPILPFLRELLGEASIYQQLLKPTLEYWKEETTVEELGRLVGLGKLYCLPLLLSGRSILSQGNFRELVRLCFSLPEDHVLCCESREDELEESCSRVAIQLRRLGDEGFEEIYRELKALDRSIVES
jgi:hypothetical protein